MNKNIPEYYYENGYLDNKIQEIQAKSQNINGAAFAFVTDIHVAKNAMHSQYIIKEIMNNTPVENVFFGGDAIDTYGKKESCLKQIEEIKAYADVIGDRFYPVRGNHDFGICDGPDDGGVGFTLDEPTSRDLIVRPGSANMHDVPGKCFYYVDDAERKIRYIILDGYEIVIPGDHPWGVKDKILQDQYEWLLNDALNVDDYTIFVFAHAPGDKKINSWAPEMIPVTELLRAYNSRNSYRLNNDVAMLYTDFKNATSTVAAFICGHNHIDDSNQEGGLLVISTVGDSLYQEPNAPERKKDTLSEHGFDIFVVDKDSRSLSAIRIGAGESREWEY